MLAPVTLPVTAKAFELVLNVKPADAPNMLPVVLNCTCVLDPAASTLPVTLPKKLAAVTLPEALMLPMV